MRRPNLTTVIELLITIVVTLRTRSQRARRRTKLRASMLRVTINTADTRRFVWLDHRGCERLSAMTRCTPLFHATHPRVAVCARAGVWRRGNCRNDAELR